MPGGAGEDWPLLAALVARPFVGTAEAVIRLWGHRTFGLRDALCQQAEEFMDDGRNALRSDHESSKGISCAQLLTFSFLFQRFTVTECVRCAQAIEVTCGSIMSLDRGAKMAFSMI